MTMKIVKENIDNEKVVTKRMGEMERGEVCWIEKHGVYILCVEHAGYPKIYLSLKDYDSAQTYGSEEHLGLAVRELYLNESITIKFS